MTVQNRPLDSLKTQNIFVSHREYLENIGKLIYKCYFIHKSISSF